MIPVLQSGNPLLWKEEVLLFHYEHDAVHEGGKQKNPSWTPKTHTSKRKKKAADEAFEWYKHHITEQTAQQKKKTITTIKSFTNHLLLKIR